MRFSSRPILVAILCSLLAYCASWNPFAFDSGPNSDQPDFHYPWDGSAESSENQAETNEDSTITSTESSETKEVKKPDPSRDSTLQIEQKEKTSRGRDIVTRFYGAELVRERIYVNGAPQWRIQLRGNATIEHGSVLIRAPAITLDAGKYGRMTGGVQIYDSENGLYIRAAEGTYNRDKEMVELSGFPYMRIKKSSQPTTHITCTRMERDLSAEVAYLRGDVRIHHSDYNILADLATYTDAKELIEIPDNPRILGKGEYLTGDRILYYTGEEKAVLDGRAIYATYEQPTEERISLEQFARMHGPVSDRAMEKARQEQPERAKELAEKENSKKTEPSGPLLQVLSADRIEHIFKDKKNPVTHITGNVLFTDPYRQLRSPALTGTGPSLAVLTTDQGVEFLDKKENVRVKAREMDYQRQKQFLTLSGDPEVEFLDEKTQEVTGTLTGAYIERDFQTEVTIARGNVELNKGSDRARGEIARYEEKNGYLEFIGNPRIFRDGSWIQCSKVRMYPDQDRIIFEKNIRGAVIQ